MVKYLAIHSKSGAKNLEAGIQQNKILINCSAVSEKENCFDIEIEFTSSIVAFRNHDYKWVGVKQKRIATDFSPKILKLENGFYVQANIAEGIWETDAKNPKRLRWRFNPDFSKPITVYSGKSNAKICIQANSPIHFTELPALLFSDKSAVESSRSKINFSAIACFTDHCDFDTPENLKAQRSFFKEKNITTTKGFFLNHFSKRPENASVENDSGEISQWRNDGHELCYHSLSQSIKSDVESFSDFRNFTPPFPEIPVWIDHGYQPYNFSLFQQHTIEPGAYENILAQKDIKILWNYIDSGTATAGVINQLNPFHFTLASFLKGNKSLGKMKLAQAMIKNSVFHYLNDEKTIYKYKLTAQNFKKIVFQKQLKIIPAFFRDFFVLFKSIASVLFFWKSNKDIPFKLATYTPLFFTHTIVNREFVVFQTLELIDFSKSLAKENVNLLIRESGIFIAHTYFSDTIKYHNGKLLTESNEPDQQVSDNFTYLSQKIKEQSIWNPTLSELYTHLQEFKKIAYDVDESGTIFVKNRSEIPSRKVI